MSDEIHLRHRSLAHREQSIGEFYHALADRIGAGRDAPVEELCQQLLEAIVRRVSPRAALHLIGRLPADLRAGLLELPPGPDRSITLARTLEELEDLFGMSREEGSRTIQSFLAFLEEQMGAGELDHLRAELPREFQRLFPAAVSSFKKAA